MKVKPGTKIDPYIVVEGPASAAAASNRLSPEERCVAFRMDFPKEAAICTKFAAPEPWSHLSCEASLIHIPDWRQGSWTIKKNPDGWKDELTGRFVSIEQVREAIATRMGELELSRDMIEDFMAPYFFNSLAACLQFPHLSFDEQMDVVRRGSR
jgi:hypothetical protein